MDQNPPKNNDIPSVPTGGLSIGVTEEESAGQSLEEKLQQASVMGNIANWLRERNRPLEDKAQEYAQQKIQSDKTVQKNTQAVQNAVWQSLEETLTTPGNLQLTPGEIKKAVQSTRKEFAKGFAQAETIAVDDVLVKNLGRDGEQYRQTILSAIETTNVTHQDKISMLGTDTINSAADGIVEYFVKTELTDQEFEQLKKIDPETKKAPLDKAIEIIRKGEKLDAEAIKKFELTPEVAAQLERALPKIEKTLQVHRDQIAEVQSYVKVSTSEGKPVAPPTEQKAVIAETPTVTPTIIVSPPLPAPEKKKETAKQPPTTGEQAVQEQVKAATAEEAIAPPAPSAAKTADEFVKEVKKEIATQEQVAAAEERKLLEKRLGGGLTTSKDKEKEVQIQTGRTNRTLFKKELKENPTLKHQLFDLYQKTPEEVRRRIKEVSAYSPKDRFGYKSDMFHRLLEDIPSAYPSFFGPSKSGTPPSSPMYKPSGFFSFFKNIFRGRSRSFFSNISGFFKNILSGFGRMFKNALPAIKTAIKGAFTALTGGIGGLVLKALDLLSKYIGFDIGRAAIIVGLVVVGTVLLIFLIALYLSLTDIVKIACPVPDIGPFKELCGKLIRNAMGIP